MKNVKLFLTPETLPELPEPTLGLFRQQANTVDLNLHILTKT